MKNNNEIEKICRYCVDYLSTEGQCSRQGSKTDPNNGCPSYGFRDPCGNCEDYSFAKQRYLHGDCPYEWCSKYFSSSNDDEVVEQEN